MATGPALTTDQNILPVQAYFNIDGSFNTFIGQGIPFTVPGIDAIGITDTTVNGTFYPTFSPVNSGFISSIAITSGSYKFNPNTGVLTAPFFSGSLTGNATSANNLYGGSAGVIPWQSAPNTTGFISAGTTGQFLQSNGTGSPTWATPVSYATVTDDTTTAGTRYPLFANQTSGTLSTEYTSSTKLQYNPSTGVFTSTSFAGAGTGLTGTATSLSIGGNAATATSATSATSATTATNLAGGANGSVPYQTASGATTFLVASTNGYVMTLAGGVPTWAASNSGITITDNTSSSSTYYPTLTTATSGTITSETTSSTKLSFIPSTGTLNTSAHGLNGSTSGTITLNSVAIAGTNTATFPAATGTVMVSGNMPAFSAYQSSSQSVTSSVYTKVQFQTKEFDTNNNFDSTTNYRFTPTVAGYYQVETALTPATTVSQQILSIYKNGTGVKNFATIAAGSPSSLVSALIYCNGSTDYLEVYAYLVGVTPSITADARYTYFQAVMVRSA